MSDQEPSTSSKYPPSWHPLPEKLPIEISTRDFQGIFLGVKKPQSWRQEWPSTPNLRSGTPNIPQVPPFLTPPSRHTSNWDINTKFSGYLLWGKKTWFMTSGMTLYIISLVRNPQCPPSTPLLEPPSWHTSNWYISTKFSGYLLCSLPKSSSDRPNEGPVGPCYSSWKNVFSLYRHTGVLWLPKAPSRI